MIFYDLYLIVLTFFKSLFITPYEYIDTTKLDKEQHILNEKRHSGGINSLSQTYIHYPPSRRLHGRGFDIHIR